MADTRWKPGQSGNPNGRPPKGDALTDILRQKIDKDIIADKLIEIALADGGDLAALKYIYDRIDGRPKETIEQTIREMPDVIEVDLSEDSTAEED